MLQDAFFCVEPAYNLPEASFETHGTLPVGFLLVRPVAIRPLTNVSSGGSSGTPSHSGES